MLSQGTGPAPSSSRRSSRTRSSSSSSTRSARCVPATPPRLRASADVLSRRTSTRLSGPTKPRPVGRARFAPQQVRRSRRQNSHPPFESAFSSSCSTGTTRTSFPPSQSAGGTSLCPHVAPLALAGTRSAVSRSRRSSPSHAAPPTTLRAGLPRSSQKLATPSCPSSFRRRPRPRLPPPGVPAAAAARRLGGPTSRSPSSPLSPRPSRPLRPCTLSFPTQHSASSSASSCAGASLPRPRRTSAGRGTRVSEACGRPSER